MGDPVLLVKVPRCPAHGGPLFMTLCGAPGHGTCLWSSLNRRSRGSTNHCHEQGEASEALTLDTKFNRRPKRSVIKGNDILVRFFKRYKLMQKKNPQWGFPGGSVVKNPPAMQEAWVRSLVKEDSTCRGTAKPVCHNY